MKERPIIFNTEMVKAILEGRKTVTRRPVKTTHKGACGFFVNSNLDDKVVSITDYDENETPYDNDTHCPFGQVGDRLYVRETWHDNYQWLQDNHGFAESDLSQYLYKASIPPCDLEVMKERGQKWCPSIHMPKGATRIWLEIIDIRVERVWDISVEDCIKEGEISHLRDHSACVDLKTKYKQTWNTIYKNWNDNPWVWVVEFKRVENG